ncbi:uncharacterized protein LOC119331921 [Triticum dicoccoides]|uniref:uncharacterized protein LOC119331921 n=1 Tax=Triticum dicoccoides TaxID=85692 RepID=UPI0018910495|nr:uncharacterized protein LOC119331921 [Triticum dicoccoides]
MLPLLMSTRIKLACWLDHRRPRGTRAPPLFAQSDGSYCLPAVSEICAAPQIAGDSRWRKLRLAAIDLHGRFRQIILDTVFEKVGLPSAAYSAPSSSSSSGNTMADGSSAMATSSVNVPIDDGLLIKSLPPLSPIRVTISKQFILERAIETIGGTLHPFTFTGTSSDDVDVSLSIDLPPHSKSMSSTRKEFHAPHIESTCVAALVYLQKTGQRPGQPALFTDCRQAETPA